MTAHDDVLSALRTTAEVAWATTNARDVPTSDSINLSNGAAKVEATYLYADLANSSQLAQTVSAEAAARVIRMYLNMAVRVLRAKGGHIRSFDGDRVMAIFMGDSKNSNAFRSALAINYYATRVIPNLISEQISEVSRAGWTLNHGIGVDTGDALIVRGGVRNNNDLISVGSAPNVAAKLADVRDRAPVHITQRSIDRVRGDYRTHQDGRVRHEFCSNKTIGGQSIPVHSSSWYWSLG